MQSPYPNPPPAGIFPQSTFNSNGSAKVASAIQESPILQKPATAATPVPINKPKKVPIKLILGGLLLMIVTIGGGVGFYLSQTSQEIRQQASSPTGTAVLTISPESTSFSPGSEQTLILKINMGVEQINIDGIQYIADISGTIPTNLSFTQATIPGLNPVTTSLIDTATGKKLSVAYITTPPSVYSANNTDLVVGTLQFTVPESGSMTLTFNPTLSKILQNQTKSDVLRTPGEPQIYTFSSGSGATNTPAPTPTVVPGNNTPTPIPTTVATSTPSPTPGAGGNSPTPTPTSLATATPNVANTATPTPTGTPTPTSVSTGGTATSTPSPVPTAQSVSQPAQTQEQPVSGSSETTLLLLLGGLFFTLSGVYLVTTGKSH